MSRATGRRSAGLAEGALTGQHPAPGLGLPSAAGGAWHDDFEAGAGELVASRYGDMLWSATTIGGAAATITSEAPGGWTEVGILQLAAAGGSGTGSILTRGTVASLYRVPPPGSIWAAKLCITSGTADYELWSGFASSAARVAAADATQFIGVRSIGGNLFGVVKNGAASETTQDLGVACEASAWRAVGFEVGGTTAAPSAQFFILDLVSTNRETWDRTNVGSAITATMPSTTLMPVAIGLVMTSAVATTAQIDYVDRGGRCARG